MITFNGIDLSDIIRVTDISGRGPISPSIIRQSIPGKEGVLFQRREITERLLSVSFIVVPESQSLFDLRGEIDT